jgi:MFS superfamily sulfate permease-like transporter
MCWSFKVVYAILAEVNSKRIKLSYDTDHPLQAPHDLKFYWKVRAWTDFLQACMTFVLTLFLSVEVSNVFSITSPNSLGEFAQIGLVASVCFSLILVIRKSTQARIKILGRLKDSDQWIPVDEHPDEDVEEDIPGVVR